MFSWVHGSKLRFLTVCNAHEQDEGDGEGKSLTGKHQGKMPLGTPRHRREENIKMYLNGMGCDSVG
jgi:hypothetical protein